MAGVLETRYELGGDVTYRAGAALLASRLVRITGAGASKTKPVVGYTTAATDLAVGATFTDAALNADVGVSHRKGSWQKLVAAEAITAGASVYPAADGRVQMFTGATGDTVPAGAERYGVAISAAAALGDPIWVKVL